MRNFPVFLFFLLTSLGGAAQTELRFGFTANPLISWMRAESAEIDRGKMRGGVEYGLITDINFTPNYILATGVTVTVGGGNLIYSEQYADSILSRYPGDTLYSGEVKAKFKLQYLNLPAVFKMRTNDIGKLKYYGGFGLVPAFRFKARVDAEKGDEQILENKNIVKRKDQTEGVLQSVVFNLSLHVEAGIELPFSGKTAFNAGIFYRNGFINILKDGDEDKVSLNNLGLRLGMIF